ncbi:MAG: Eco57I restriction-modification methylase domain-containing protein [Proteobacteria bacterium]|nr:Eco57I restriction-modification methylase domain-containing protein [Pseudomonadota bacterium]
MESDQFTTRIPTPDVDERPTVYADRVGRWYATLVSDDHKRRFGQYLTPVGVAMFMAMLYQSGVRQQFRMLDPGAGSGVLACALLEVLAFRKERPSSIELIAYEIDPELAFCLEACLSYANQWLTPSKIRLQFTIIKSDFVLDHAEVLERTQRLFTEQTTGGNAGSNAFDAVIANPPYFKIPKSDLRARAAAAVVHGQPNLYALFMAVCAQLLKPQGEMIIITPRSYAAGPYFRRFREHFFAVMRPESIHLFGSRRDAFNRDNILQENVILHAKKILDTKEIRQSTMVQVSISDGASDLTQVRRRMVPLIEILDLSSRDKMLQIPVDDVDDETCRAVRSWPGRLHAYGMEISTGPVVPFRAVSFLDHEGQSPESHVPLLWMQNVKAMCVTWPTAARGKPQHIKVSSQSMPLLVADKNYILLRRFSAKEQARRLTAAPLIAGALGSPWVGLENHVNFIHRPGGTLTQHEVYGLAVLLNSRLLDIYFRVFNGNTQVSATELRALPLPPLDAIMEIGKMWLSTASTVENIDALIEEVLAFIPPEHMMETV